MKFSIIIPSRNRPDQLQMCLNSLTRINQPAGQWEIIVACDGETPEYAAILNHFSQKLPLTHVTLQPSGPAVARNVGSRQASGDYLVFLDDDCLVDKDWLLGFEEALTTTQKDALGGKTLNATPHLAGACAWHHLVDFLYLYWSDKDLNRLILISNNVVYKRQIFQEIGGFDQGFTMAASEDRDISWRMLAQGHTQGFTEKAVVWHAQDKLTGLKYLQLQYRYGRGSARFHQVTKQQYPSVLQRFGPNSRAKYVKELLRYLIKKQVRLDVAILLLCGHLAHLLGRRSQSSQALTVQTGVDS